MSERDDVLVVGGGVIGLASALALLDAGRSVRVLEAKTAGCGSSHGNCGTITPSHAAPLTAPGKVAKALHWMLTPRSEEHTSELQSLMRISYAVFCLKKKKHR